MRAEPFYHRRLDASGPSRGRPSSRARKIEQQVRDELAGTVIGDLAAAIDLEHRNAVVAQQVLAPAGEPERVDRRMLGEPDFVAASPAVRASVNACIARHVAS